MIKIKYFSFEIKDSRIERTDTNVFSEENIEKIFCKFSFKTPNWNDIEKYVIFWNSKNKSTIISLGKKSKGCCQIPKDILKESLFQIQIYANKDLSTQKLDIEFIPYSNIKKEENRNGCDRKKEIRDEYNSQKIFEKLFSKIDAKADKIEYENGFLKCYANNKLIYSAPLFSDLKNDFQDEIHNLVSEGLVHTHGNISYDGRIGSEPNKPLITTNNGVITTGRFGDSENTFCEGNDERLSDERTPKPHTHVSDEITDFEDTTSVEIKKGYNLLVSKIRTYGQ